jgi:hypothetical protein
LVLSISKILSKIIEGVLLLLTWIIGNMFLIDFFVLFPSFVLAQVFVLINLGSFSLDTALLVE